MEFRGGEFRRRESCVVSQIEIRFSTVVGNKYFPMLIGAHRSRVDIQIWIDFYHADRKSAAFQQAPKGRRRDALAKTRTYAARDENVLPHGILLSPAIGVRVNAISNGKAGKISLQTEKDRNNPPDRTKLSI